MDCCAFNEAFSVILKLSREMPSKFDWFHFEVSEIPSVNIKSPPLICTV
jgi:hypothetical protein